MLSNHEIIKLISNYIIGIILTNENEITHIDIIFILDEFNLLNQIYFISSSYNKIEYIIRSINEILNNCKYIRRIDSNSNNIAEMDFERIERIKP